MIVDWVHEFRPDGKDKKALFNYLTGKPATSAHHSGTPADALHTQCTSPLCFIDFMKEMFVKQLSCLSLIMSESDEVKKNTFLD